MQRAVQFVQARGMGKLDGDVGILAATSAARWYLAAVGSKREIAQDEIAEHFDAGFVNAVGVETVQGWISRMAAQTEVVEPVTAVEGKLRVPLRPFGSVPRWRVLLTIGDDERIHMFEFGSLEVEGAALDRVATATIDDEIRSAVHRLFDANYDHADHAYLDESMGRLDVLALARSTEEDSAGSVVGFALGAYRVVDIPRKPQQDIKLSGLVCVDPAFRRRGLASRLGEVAIAGGVMPAEDVLFGGRMAHPASYRQASARVGSVPRPDRRTNAWQRECGVIIAGLLGIGDFDPETFVCRGRGRTIGEPRVEVDVSPEEWKVFEPVDRKNGDTLLAIWWGGDPGPKGWIDES